MKVEYSTSKPNMGYLTGKTSYLAGNIHTTADNDYGVGWREEVANILEQRYGVSVINPCTTGKGDAKEDQIYFRQLIKDRKITQVKNEFWKVIRKDLRAVDKADFLVLLHDPHIPTIGTIHEVVNANNQKKPILIVCDEKKMDDLNPWLLTLIKPQWLFPSFAKMTEYLDQIHNNMDINKLDTSWWWY